MLPTPLSSSRISSVGYPEINHILDGQISDQKYIWQKCIDMTYSVCATKRANRDEANTIYLLDTNHKDERIPCQT